MSNCPILLTTHFQFDHNDIPTELTHFLMDVFDGFGIMTLVNLCWLHMITAFFPKWFTNHLFSNFIIEFCQGLTSRIYFDQNIVPRIEAFSNFTIKNYFLVFWHLSVLHVHTSPPKIANSGCIVTSPSLSVLWVMVCLGWKVWSHLKCDIVKRDIPRVVELNSCLVASFANCVTTLNYLHSFCFLNCKWS